MTNRREIDMRENIFLSMLEITKSMHMLAIDSEWDKVSRKEEERQQLIKELGSIIDEDNDEKKSILIEIIREMNDINQKINELATNANASYRHEILKLKKGKKAKSLYLE